MLTSAKSNIKTLGIMYSGRTLIQKKVEKTKYHLKRNIVQKKKKNCGIAPMSMSDTGLDNLPDERSIRLSSLSDPEEAE